MSHPTPTAPADEPDEGSPTDHDMSPAATTRRAKAQQALARGASHKEAAAYAGVSTKSIQRFLANGNFRQAVRQAQIATHDAAMASLITAATEAVQVLVECMSAADRDSTRVNAATHVLKLTTVRLDSYRLDEALAGIERRLDKLEQTDEDTAL